MRSSSSYQELDGLKSERADAVGAIVKGNGYKQVQETLDILADNESQTTETRSDAWGLSAKMDELKAGFMTELS